MARKKTTVTEEIEGDEQELTRAGGPGSGSWDGPGQPRYATATKADYETAKTSAKTASLEADTRTERAYGSGKSADHVRAFQQHNDAATAHEDANLKHLQAKGYESSEHSTASKEHRESAARHLKAAEAAYQNEQSLATGGSGGAHKASASLDTSADVLQVCRALNSSAQFDGSADARFMWMPAGRAKELHLTYDDKPATVFISCNKGDEATVNASFIAMCEKASPQKPFGDIEHRRTEASFWPQGFEWSGASEREGIYVRAEWSGLGKKHVTEKIHRSFSPSFKTDAQWSWDKDNQRYYCKAGERGSQENPARITGVGFDVGTLTNQPAFKDMQPLFARENVAAKNNNTGGAAAAQEISMNEQELAAQKAAQEKLSAENAELRATLTKQNDEQIDAAIVRAVGRNAIEAKNETVKASYKSLGKTDAKSVVAIIDSLPAIAAPGTTRAVESGDGKVAVGGPSFEDAFKGWTKHQVPQNGLIRSGRVQEAVKLSRASAGAYRDLERMIVKGADVSMPDMIARAADVTTNVDGTFGTLSGLLLVLQRNLGFLKNRLIGVDQITTDFRNEPAAYDQWVRTRYLTYPTVYDYTASTFSSTTPSSTETQKTAAGVTDVDVKINKNKRVWVPIDTAVLSGTVRNLFQEQKAPGIYALADQMNQDLITNIINGNVDANGATIVFTTADGTLSVADAKDVQTWVPAIGLKADVAKMPDMGRFMFLHSAYWRAMQSDKNFAQLQAIARASLAGNPLSGELENPYGFDFHQSQLMKDNADYTAAKYLGFVGTRESLILVGRVPQDYTQAIEAPPTATIQIITEPETGLSIMVSQFVNNNLETANLRLAIMYGTGVGQKTNGFLIKQA